MVFVERAIWLGPSVCGSTHSTPLPHRHGPRCRDCRYDFTVRHGTIFAYSRLLLQKWLWAIYLTRPSRKGFSSVQLAKPLDVTQKTAWFMQQRLRQSADSTHPWVIGNLSSRNSAMRRWHERERKK